MDRELQSALVDYSEQCPELVEERRRQQDRFSRGAALEYLRLDDAAKIQDLIVLKRAGKLRNVDLFGDP
jgi:hypothetical protein